MKKAKAGCLRQVTLEAFLLLGEKGRRLSLDGVDDRLAQGVQWVMLRGQRPKWLDAS
jgi:hypothetical protein